MCIRAMKELVFGNVVTGCVGSLKTLCLQIAFAIELALTGVAFIIITSFQKCCYCWWWGGLLRTIISCVIDL